VFETDAKANYFLVILTAHATVSNGESNGATILLFRNIENIIAFSNGVSN